MAAVSKAQMRAVAKYDKQNYDRVLVRFPKGWKSKVKACAASCGISANAFIVGAVEGKIMQCKNKTAGTDSTGGE